MVANGHTLGKNTTSNSEQTMTTHAADDHTNDNTNDVDVSADDSKLDISDRLSEDDNGSDRQGRQEQEEQEQEEDDDDYDDDDVSGEYSNDCDSDGQFELLTHKVAWHKDKQS